MEARKPDYKQEVENILYLYPVYKKSLETMYPSCTSAGWEEEVRGGPREYKSTTEKYGIKRAHKSQLIDQIDHALEVLSPTEEEVIRATYFRLDQQPLDLIHQQIGLGRATYFRTKRRAIERLALILF